MSTATDTLAILADDELRSLLSAVGALEGPVACDLRIQEVMSADEACRQEQIAGPDDVTVEVEDHRRAPGRRADATARRRR